MLSHHYTLWTKQREGHNYRKEDAPLAKTSVVKNRLNELFERDSCTDTEHAKKLGVSKQTISAWRNGERSPGRASIHEISKTYSVTEEWLLGWDLPNPQNYPDENHKKIALRLYEVMQDKGLRQVDVVELAKPYCNEHNIQLQKSDISQYLSGKAVPKAQKLKALANALNVDEAWLLGFDSASAEVVKLYETLDSTRKSHLMSYLRFLIKDQEEAWTQQ